MVKNKFTPSVIITQNSVNGIIVKSLCDHPDCDSLINYLVFASLPNKKITTYKSCCCHLEYFKDIALKSLER